MHIRTILAFLLSMCSLQLSAATLEGRSFADHCQFIYRIETEFKLEIPLDRKKYLAQPKFEVWLVDLYTDKPVVPMEIEYSFEDEGYLVAQWSMVTMSTNPRYLAHNVFMKLNSEEESVWSGSFSHLMNRCRTPKERDRVPFQAIELQASFN